MQGRRQGDGRDGPNVRPRADDDITIELDDQPMTADRVAQYRDWAERLRQKRETARQHINGTPAATAPSYWNTDDVFRETRRLVDEEVPPRTDPIVQDLLAVFGIEGQPAPHQVESAFRRLAKQHHPDCHIGADAATRAFHLDQMRRINEAYSRLRQLQLN